jgi:hypothetical protein
MVNWLPHLILADVCLLAQTKKPATALEKMDEKQRAKVLAALAAFVILGFGLMALAWLGARVTRRYMNQEPLRRRDPAHVQDDWSAKPLASEEPDTEDGNEQDERDDDGI